MTSNAVGNSDNTSVVLVLFFLWVILALALVYFYKKLNADTDGRYTIQRIVFGQGGLRDRLRQGVGFVENRFGVHIWPRPREDEENIRGSEEGAEGDEDNDKQNESDAEEGEDRENDDIRDDSSDDYSSFDMRERANQKNDQEEKRSQKSETEAEQEKQKEESGGEEDKQGEEVKNREKVELLIDIKPFEGCAIWSEESKNEENDLTAL